jgi:hypothetical protein
MSRGESWYLTKDPFRALDLSIRTLANAFYPDTLEYDVEWGSFFRD